MDNNEFRKSAITFLYPDGKVKYIPIINERYIHLNYYIDLYHNSFEFRKLADENDIYIPDSIYDSKMIVTNEIDKDLARIGIIVFHNMMLNRIYRDKDYIKNTPPQFYITLPYEFTNEQIGVLKNLCTDNDMSCSIYGMLIDEDIDDITYEEFALLIREKQKGR